MFRIGEFSKLCQLPTSVLRYYDEIGIFKPARIDSFTGYRYYSVHQLPRLNRILALKDLGLSLTEIDRIINEQIAPDKIRGMLRLKEAELSQQMAEVQAKLHRISNRLRQIESEHKMPDYEVLVKPAEAVKIAAIREIVPEAAQMPARSGAMFEAVLGWLREQNRYPAGPALAIYYNPEYVERNIDVENGFVVEPGLEAGEYSYQGHTIVVREIPRIESVASTIHRGSFDSLINAWQALAAWIEANQYEIIGPPSREFYLSKPGEAPIAEIQYLVNPLS